MADTAISALPAGAAIGGSEPIPAVQTGATVRVTPAQMATYQAALTQTLTNKTLTSPAETIQALGNLNSNTDINLSLGSVVTATVTGAFTWTFSTPPAGGFHWRMRLTNGGSAVVGWPGSVTWVGGVAPVLQASGTDVLEFFTVDGGTASIGWLVGDPIQHASMHQSGGSDAIKLDDLATPDDNTDLNASTTRHGLLPKLSNVATEFLNGTGAFSVPTVASVSRTVDMFTSGTVLDATGDAFFEPYSILATNDLFRHLILRCGANNAAAPTVKAGVYGRFQVPEDYNTGGTVTCIVYWTTTLTSGDVVFDLDYRAIGGDDAESLDQSSYQESLTVTDTAPSAAHERQTATMTFTAGNLLAGDTVEFFFGRDGAAGADTLAGSALVHAVVFKYTT